MATILESAALLLVAYKRCMFIIGLVAKDNSLIDIACGSAFVVVSWSD